MLAESANHLHLQCCVSIVPRNLPHKMAEKKSKEPYHAQNGREEVQRKRTHELENTGSETFSFSVAAVIF
jgi:ribosomal protein S19E (S16A)